VAPPNRTARVAVLGSSVQRSKSGQRPPRGRATLVRRLVLAVLVVVALALLTISFRSPTSGFLHDAQGTGAEALRPFQIAAERVAQPFRDVYGYFHGLTTAKSQNEKLRREVQQLRAEKVQYQAAAAQVPALKRQLHYLEGPTYPKDYRPVNAAVISFPSGPFDQQITIAAGSSSGIHYNAPVVTADGLVGRVTNVFPSTSVATLITDADSAVAATDLSTGVSGLVRRGQGDSLILDRVPKNEVVQKGDQIVTQGTRDPQYPDIYPYGIPIGKVLSVGYSDNAIFVQVQVAPYAQFGSFDAVTVLVSKKPEPKVP
jgi:rod shape-determining protein MreC